MAIVLLEVNLDDPEFLYLKPYKKLKISVAKFLGTTYPVAKCTLGGTSGLVEPAFDTAVVGETVVDNSCEWQVSRVTGHPSAKSWLNLHQYTLGVEVLGTVKHQVTPGQATLSVVTTGAKKKRPIASNMFRSLPGFNWANSRWRRAFLSMIWKHVLLSTDRASWVSFASGWSIENFRWVGKIMSGWELFQYCNLSGGVGWNVLPDGQIGPDFTLPPRSLLFIYLPQPFAPTSSLLWHSITAVVDQGGGSFLLTADSDFLLAGETGPPVVFSQSGALVSEYTPNALSNPKTMTLSASISGYGPGIPPIMLSVQVGPYPHTPWLSLNAGGGWSQADQWTIDIMTSGSTTSLDATLVCDDDIPAPGPHSDASVLTLGGGAGTFAVTLITCDTPDAGVFSLPDVFSAFGGVNFMSFDRTIRNVPVHVDLFGSPHFAAVGPPRRIANLGRVTAIAGPATDQVVAVLVPQWDNYWNPSYSRPRLIDVGFRVSDADSPIPSPIYSLPSTF